MTEKQSEQKNKRKRIEFSLHAPHANEVLLMGDFNQWDGKKHYMKKVGQGAWEKALMLTPGTYEYKFIVDGSWQEDPANRQNRLNPFGTYNNLLNVTE
ncbi:MAG: glycogen-binding domain-containing protein [Proteobacteria bacterium]|nr:glycogen-binding domain-containing protein [Pseudomonadota bacterium]MBU1586181.1 glycogen-binding domain-containing protein [Pseudomonadota bacterium]MBU2453052.1 glycogen-binding domain-containing protein [Pseudomonadota bacterium]MBU2631996.1 glycogen-binding domain-containing protein [Pseudomonadota bacterium]